MRPIEFSSTTMEVVYVLPGAFFRLSGPIRVSQQFCRAIPRAIAATGSEQLPLGTNWARVAWDADRLLFSYELTRTPTTKSLLLRLCFCHSLLFIIVYSTCVFGFIPDQLCVSSAPVQWSEWKWMMCKSDLFICVYIIRSANTLNPWNHFLLLHVPLLWHRKKSLNKKEEEDEKWEKKRNNKPNTAANWLRTGKRGIEIWCIHSNICIVHSQAYTATWKMLVWIITTRNKFVCALMPCAIHTEKMVAIAFLRLSNGMPSNIWHR